MSNTTELETGNSYERSRTRYQEHNLPFLICKESKELGPLREDSTGEHWPGQHLLRGELNFIGKM